MTDTDQAESKQMGKIILWFIYTGMWICT